MDVLDDVLQGIEQGRTAQLLRDHDKCPPCCPVRTLIVQLDRAFNANVEQGLVDWLRGVSHEPACGRDHPGDLVRWVTMQGQRLPTVRVDLVEKVCQREVWVAQPGGGPRVECVAYLSRALTPDVRLRFAKSQAVLG